MWRFLLPLLLIGCAKSQPPNAAQTTRLDAVLIPGCPSQDDGTLSGCQWQRAIWGAMLYEQGVTERLIPSGNACYNRYVEAEAIRAGLIALGVPAEAIVTETQALHSDQNAAYTLPILDSLRLRSLGVASHRGHARGIVAMLDGWGFDHATPLDMPLEPVMARMRDGLPQVQTQPVPETEWLPLRKRERALAKQNGRRRPHSLILYPWMAIAGNFKQFEPPLPPGPEPSLAQPPAAPGEAPMAP